MAPGAATRSIPRGEAGQSLLLMLGLLAALMLGALVLAAFGQALGARGRHQKAADLAAITAAQTMRGLYARLFEPAYLESGARNPRHLSLAAYLRLARAAAIRGGARNGVRVRAADIGFPAGSFGPTRVTVAVRGAAAVALPGPHGRRLHRLPVRARATAELAPPAALPVAEGGGYHGPLAYRQGKPMRPDVALAFDRLAAAARREAGIALIVVSGYRSDAEQAKLFAAHPDPKWVAPPGRSLHRLGTELDLGPPGAYGWLHRNARRFGFIQRYSWEAWH
jgi:hypothetical protein